MIYETLYLETFMSGGKLTEINEILQYVNNSNNLYLTNNKQNDEKITFTFHNNPNDLIFEEETTEIINDENTPDNILSPSKKVRKNTIQFLNHGSSNVVFRIKNTKTNEILILKVKLVSKKILDKINIIIDKYLSDKDKYKNHIPDISRCGILINNYSNSNKTHYYVIMREYGVDFQNFSFTDRLCYFTKFTKILSKIQNDNAYVRDLKIENMGYDENKNPVFIDYDETTIETYDKNNFEGHTYFPCYAVIEKLAHKTIHYDKINVLGYSDILLKLFFNPYDYKKENEIRFNKGFLNLFFTRGILKFKNNLELGTQNIRPTNKIHFYDTGLTENAMFIEMFISNLEEKYTNGEYCAQTNQTLKNILRHTMAVEYDDIYTYETIYKKLILELSIIFI